MIRFKDLRDRLDAEPFTPFVIRVEDGRAFKVLRPNLCILTRSAAYVGVPDRKLPRLVARVDYCPFDFAIGIEDMKSASRRHARSTRGRRNGRGESGNAR